MATEVELLEKIVKLERNLLWFDLYRFVGLMINAGYGWIDIGSYVLTVPANGEIGFDSANPAGYVWVPIKEQVWVETKRVLALKVVRDNKIFINMPAITDFEYQWEISPYTGVIREIASITVTNSDVADRWFIGGYLGAFIKVDQYEAFQNMLKLASIEFGLGA